MDYQVEWSPRAVEDLEAIAAYIAADSAAYAAAVVKTILNTASNFSRFPFSGRVVPELGVETFVSGSPTVIELSIELTMRS
jgi:toxin ParE1/3/4